VPTAFDLHIHTSRHSPDSIIEPLALVRRARQLGLQGVVITEHDWLWTPAELDELRAAVPGLLVFAGIEVTAHEGHFLVHGVTNPFAVPRGIGLVALCREVHRQGGAVIAAHPYRWGQPFDDILAELQPPLDGLELMTNNMDADSRRRAAAVRAARGWTGLGSSDAHQEDVVGVCYTEFPHPIRDQRDLIEALRSGLAVARARTPACQARPRPGWPFRDHFSAVTRARNGQPGPVPPDGSLFSSRAGVAIRGGPS
jgi:predicted metal-dependent phosphoesterase TrpH